MLDSAGVECIPYNREREITKEEVVANLMEYRILRKEVQRLFIQKKDKKGLKKILGIIKKMQDY